MTAEANEAIRDDQAYVIVESDSAWDLSRKVSEYLLVGYKCVGGVIVLCSQSYKDRDGDTQTTYTQLGQAISRRM